MAKENKQLIKTWEDRYQDYLNSGLSIHKWCTLNGIANKTDISNEAEFEVSDKLIPEISIEDIKPPAKKEKGPQGLNN